MRVFAQTQGKGNGGRNAFWLGHSGQVHEPGAVRPQWRFLPRHTQCQAGLAGAGGPDQRGQPDVGQRFGKAQVVPFTPHQRRQRRREIARARFRQTSGRGHTISLHLDEARDGPGVRLRPVLFPAVYGDIADVEQFGQLDLREAQ